MDELLAFMDADLKATLEQQGKEDGGDTSAPEPAAPSRRPVTPPVPKKAAPSTSKSTFTSIFGSPDKRDLSDLCLRQKIRTDAKVPHKPEVGILPVIDPYSRVRLVKSSISIYFDESMTAEAALKDTNIGLEFVGLGALRSGTGRRTEIKEFPGEWRAGEQDGGKGASECQGQRQSHLGTE